MESLIHILELFFRRVSSRDILNGHIDYANFDRKCFTDLSLAHRSRYSGDEAGNLFRYLQEELKQDADGAASCVNVLDALQKFDALILKEVEEIPVCRYRYLLEWRKASFALEEELFTTSFLASRDQKKERSFRQSFDWKYVIGNDNVELNNMLKRGLVDNHYHLKGSAPYFYMSWMNLMNRVDDAAFRKVLKSYDENRLEKFSVYRFGAMEESLEVLHLQAALIRLYLFSWLTGRNLWIQEEYFMDFGQIRNVMDWSVWGDDRDIGQQVRAILSGEEKMPVAVALEGLKAGGDRKRRMLTWICRNLAERMEVWELADTDGYLTERGFIYRCFAAGRKIRVDREFLEIFVCRKEKEKLREWICLKSIEELLAEENRSELLWNRDRIQAQLNSVRAEGREPDWDKVYDYTQNREGAGEENLFGERWFLYTMFRRLYQGNPAAKLRGNLFYAYLVIKERIRSELIQVNERVGFDNFLRYQNRKEEFIENTPLDQVYSRHAVIDSFQEQPLDILEARITPRMTAEENYAYIKKLDAGILKNPPNKFVNGQPLTPKDFFYVFHFVKEPEPDGVVTEYECRHYKLRKKVRRQAVGIYNLRSRYARMAGRVYGIDACSPEIGCRPEVFGQAFRYLKYEQNFLDGTEPEIRRPRLRSTFHVGEDFLDIVDGMRAIDEAIFYCNLTHGDRLGHALALGISPADWYAFKRNKVLCSKQDILDNTVWIHQKIRKYKIGGTEAILMKLQRRFVHLYQEIYGKNGEDAERGCDIDLYYDAWKLRGDDPKMYYEGRIKEKEWAGAGIWDEYAKNRKYPELERIRKEQACVKLYYRYHYDKEVKERGQAILEYRVEQDLIAVTEKIQRGLQLDILDKGLAIEANPSSNYLIGTFRSYDRHPIIQWYNKQLTWEREELESCPQLDVTINTDDQAVFGTSLENEYALMAITLERATDGNGNLRYKKDMIYDWLEEIRRKGFIRCFRQRRSGMAAEEEREETWEKDNSMGTE